MGRESICPVIQGLSVALVLCLSTTMPFTSLGGSASVDGKIVELEGGLPPVSGGVPIVFEADPESFRILAWGYGGPSDVRVLNDSLATLGVLPIPEPSFRVNGVSMAEGGERAIVWGSTTNGTGDRLLFYDLITFELEEGYMPAGLVPLVTIDYARFYAWDLILAIAGRAANGTSQIVFVETLPMQVLTLDDVPENLTVEGMYRDMSSMTCTLEDGSVLVFSTQAWTYQERIRIADGPITASSAMARPWVFGDAQGSFVFIDYTNDLIRRYQVREGASIEGVALWEETSRDAVIIAMSNPPGGALLRTYTLEVDIWVENSELATDTHVSMMLTHPWVENVTLVGFDDGSLKLYEAQFWHVFDTNEPGLMPWIGTGTLLLLCVLVAWRVLKWLRDRPTKGAGQT